jgi:hypothetical protein
MGSIQEEIVPVAAEAPPAASRPRDAILHWVFLIMAAVVLGLAFFLRAPGGEAVLLPLLNLPLPGVCTFKQFTGTGCPGCGLTRSFISIAHGDFAAAWRYNPAGMLLFAAAVFQLPFRTAQIWRVRRGLPEWRWRALDACLWLMAAALMIQWIVRAWAPGWLQY